MKTQIPRYLTLLAVAAMLLGALPSRAPAQEVVPAAQNDGIINPGDRAVVFDGPLNLRSGAGTGTSVIAVLQTGAEMTVLAGPVAATGYSWFQVDPDTAAVGWVAGAFITEVGFAIGALVFVNTDALNVRSAPGTGSAVLGVVFTNTVGEIIGGPQSASGYVWYRVDFEGPLTGWVAGIYLALFVGPPPGDIPYDAGDWLFVFDPPVNVRAAAGTAAAIVGSLGDGAGVQVLAGPTAANGYSWYQVTWQGGTGWVASDFFTGGFELGELAFVADGPLNLRQSASTGSAILAVLAQDELVTVQNVQPTVSGGHWWFQVASDGNPLGYVSGRYLARLLF